MHDTLQDARAVHADPRLIAQLRALSVDLMDVTNRLGRACGRLGEHAERLDTAA